jgi:hypothetical protein
MKVHIVKQIVISENAINENALRKRLDKKVRRKYDIDDEKRKQRNYKKERVWRAQGNKQALKGKRIRCRGRFAKEKLCKSR